MLTQFVEDIKKHFKYAVYSARAQLKSEVAGSYLNWIWWVLEPFCFMLIYSLVFGMVFHSQELYFSAFIFIGITVWDFFSRNMKQGVRLIKRNKAIVGKVYIPKFILVLSKMFVNGFKMLICLAIVVILMVVLQVPISFNVLFIIPLMVILWIMSFGLMCILTHFGVFIEDLENLVGIVLRFMFYLTGIFYSIEHKIGKSHPEIAALLEKCNPMAYIICSLRNSLLYKTTPNVIVMLIWLGVSIVIAMIGIRIIYKNENSYAKVI